MQRVLAVLLVLATSGCAMFGRNFVTPEIKVVNLAFGDLTFFETSAVFELRVENENPFALEVEGGSYRLYVNDIFIGKGLDKDGFKVDRLSTVTFPVTVSINNLSMMTKFQSLIAQPTLRYRVESTLYPKNSFGSVKSVDSGELSFAGATDGGGYSGRKFR